MADRKKLSKSYEIFCLEKIRNDWGDYFFEYHHNVYLPDLVTGEKRQIDGLIVNRETQEKYILETKYHKAKASIGLIESFCTKRKDVGARLGIFIAPNNFSKTSYNKAAFHKLELKVFTEADFERYQHFDQLAALVFPYDIAFKRDIRKTLTAIDDNNTDKVLESLESVPYEEWLACVKYGIDKYKITTTKLLKWIAANYPDDGWRFNAVHLLDDANKLAEDLRKMLLNNETDPEIIELLNT